MFESEDVCAGYAVEMEVFKKYSPQESRNYLKFRGNPISIDTTKSDIEHFGILTMVAERSYDLRTSLPGQLHWQSRRSRADGKEHSGHEVGTYESRVLFKHYFSGRLFLKYIIHIIPTTFTQYTRYL